MTEAEYKMIADNGEKIYPYIGIVTPEDIIKIMKVKPQQKLDVRLEKILKAGLSPKLITANVQEFLVCVGQVCSTSMPNLYKVFIIYNVNMSDEVKVYALWHFPEVLFAANNIKISHELLSQALPNAGDKVPSIVSYMLTNSMILTEEEKINYLKHANNQSDDTVFGIDIRKISPLSEQVIKTVFLTDKINDALLKRILRLSSNAFNNVSHDLGLKLLEVEEYSIPALFKSLPKPVRTPAHELAFLVAGGIKARSYLSDNTATLSEEAKAYLEAYSADPTKIAYEKLSSAVLVALIKSRFTTDKLSWYKMVEVILQRVKNMPQNVLDAILAGDAVAVQLVKNHRPELLPNKPEANKKPNPKQQTADIKTVEQKVTRTRCRFLGNLFGRFLNK